MANPNLLDLTSIKLANYPLTLGTSTAILMAAASNKVVKVISLYLANKSASTVSATITATAGAANNTTVNLAYQVDIPPDSTLQLITKDAPIVLTENDYISGLASAATSIDAFVSVEEMT